MKCLTNMSIIKIFIILHVMFAQLTCMTLQCSTLWQSDLCSQDVTSTRMTVFHTTQVSSFLFLNLAEYFKPDKFC